MRPIALNLVLVLLPIEEDSVFNKKSYKKYAFVAPSSYHLEIVFILVTKVVTFHV